jgi:hypothetical protein
MTTYAESLVRDSFLDFLHRADEEIRLSNYRYYDEYYLGYHKDTLHPDIKKAFENPMSMIANYCKAVVDIPTQYIVGDPDKLGIDASQLGQKTDLALAVEGELYRIYRDSGLMDAEMIELVENLIKKGDNFLKLQNIPTFGGGQDIRIRVIRPDVCYPRFRSDDYKDTLYTAIKWYEYVSADEINWYAQVFYPPTDEQPVTEMHTYDLGHEGVPTERQFSEDDDGNVIQVSHLPPQAPVTGHRGMNEYPIAVEETQFPGIPIFQVRNNAGDRPWGVSDLHDITGPQDALNKAWTDLLYIMDDQAFQRIFLFGAHGESRLDLSPAKITNIPNESGRLDVIPPTNISQFLFVIDSLLDTISGVSGTPKQAFGEFIQGLPASGFALIVRYMSLENKCNIKRAMLKGVLRRMNQMIVYMLGLYGRFNNVPGYDPEQLPTIDVKIHFPGGLPKDEVQQAQVHSYELQMGVKSRRTIMEERGIENIEEEERRLGIDQLVAWAQEQQAIAEEEAEAEAEANAKTEE